MSRVLLADDSPHAQRMGERILREEGFEVVTVTDGLTALMRLSDVDPDLVFADASLPRKSGYDICREIKSRARHRHVRVVLTAGMLEAFDEAQAEAVRCDAVLKKPFEASAVLETIRPLLDAATRDRAAMGPMPGLSMTSDVNSVVPVKVVLNPQDLSVEDSISDEVTSEDLDSEDPEVSGFGDPTEVHPTVEVDPDRVRAAVTVALDAALPAMIDKITEQVLVALGH